MKNADEMKSKIVLAAGGTSAAGECLVKKFLAAGAQVVVSSRSAEKIATFLRKVSDSEEKSPVENLLTFEQNIGTDDGAARVRDEILQRFGRLDTVIACFGGNRKGLPLVKTPLEIWNEILRDNLTAHFVVAKNFLPVLLHQNSGSYIFVAHADSAAPIFNSIPVSVAAAGEIMLAQGLMLENSNSGVRIEMVMTGAAILSNDPAQIRMDEVAEYIVKLVNAAPPSRENTEPIPIFSRKHLDDAFVKLSRL